MLILGLAAVAAGCASSDTAAPGSGGASGGGSGGASGSGGAGSGGASATGGSNGGSGGASGSGGAVAPGTGGSGGASTDGPVAGDAGRDSGSGGAAIDPDGGLPPLMECTKASLDRIEDFNATGEGTTTPMSGSLLVKQGTGYVAKETFIGSDWHVLEILIGNGFDAQHDHDFSNSQGITLTWSSTAPLWIQMRPGFHYDGGAQWVTAVPSTSGQMKTQFFPFDAASWTTISLGKPTWTYAMARANVRGLLFVGDAANSVVIAGLRIDGYTPPCM
jgi:hypothetical protein